MSVHGIVLELDSNLSFEGLRDERTDNVKLNIERFWVSESRINLKNLVRVGWG